MTGWGQDPGARRWVEQAAARTGVHAGLFQARAASVVREMLNDELGADADRCAPDVGLLAEAVGTGLAARATQPRVTPAAFAEYVTRLSATSSMSDDDARWALTTWAAAASGGTIDPALVAAPGAVKGTKLPAAAAIAPSAGTGSGARSRRPALLVVVAVVLVGLGTLAVLRLTNPSGTAGDGPSAEQQIADRWVGVAAGNPGPFASGAAFIDALAVPKTFTRLSPDRASAFADAEFLATTDFETTCADLARSLQATDPTFPSPTPVDYPTGGVSRCEAEAPVAALGDLQVRVLVLKIDNRVQIYVDDPVAGAVPEPAPPTSPTTGR